MNEVEKGCCNVQGQSDPFNVFLVSRLVGAVPANPGLVSREMHGDCPSAARDVRLARCPELPVPPTALQVKRLQDLQLEGLLQPAQAVAFQQQAEAYPDMSLQRRRELCDSISEVWHPQASSGGAARPSAGVISPAVRGSSRSRQVLPPLRRLPSCTCMLVLGNAYALHCQPC